MSLPLRIQRKRTKGWRMPVTAKYVGRGTRFGNPYRVGVDAKTTTGVVEKYREWLMGDSIGAFITRMKVRGLLRGKDLACWCPLCERHKNGKPLGEDCPDCAPCHADVLGEIAMKQEGKTL